MAPSTRREGAGVAGLRKDGESERLGHLVYRPGAPIVAIKPMQTGKKGDTAGPFGDRLAQALVDADCVHHDRVDVDER